MPKRATSAHPPPPPESKAVGRRIATLREELELTQEEVAELAAMDRAYYASVEVGLRNPSLRQFLRIARALKVPLAELFAGIK